MNITKYVAKMFAHSFSKEWYETYWVIDLHGTIIEPTYKGTEVIYYPYAQNTLRLLSSRSDIKLILWTSSFPKEIESYIQRFKDDEITFDAINENPGISSKNGNFGFYEKKFYFNVLIDDKAGFDPHKDWEKLYFYLLECKTYGYIPDSRWTTKY
jgi:hypothetical protein